MHKKTKFVWWQEEDAHDKWLTQGRDNVMPVLVQMITKWKGLAFPTQPCKQLQNILGFCFIYHALQPL